MVWRCPSQPRARAIRGPSAAEPVAIADLPLHITHGGEVLKARSRARREAGGSNAAMADAPRTVAFQVRNSLAVADMAAASLR